MKIFLSGFLLLFTCLAGCKQSPEVKDVVAAAKNSSAKLSVYEGLPHQGFEGELLRKELKEKQTVKLHDYPIYLELPNVSESHVSNLRAILGDYSSYSPFSGEKKCGGFRPDFAVQFTSKNDQLAALICF